MDSSEDFAGIEGEHEHLDAGEVVEEDVQVHVVKGYWETIREFWDQQPEIESAPADVSVPSYWLRVAGDQISDI